MRRAGAIGTTRAASTPQRPGRGPGGFSLPTGATPAQSAAVAVALPAAPLLALQAAAASAGATAMLEHAEVMLGQLAGLQRAMLRDDAAGGASALAELSQAIGPVRAGATDPALAEILDALALRAAVEVAKRGAGGTGRGG